MKIIEKINDKNKKIYEAKPVTIAFLGDSITQGCFECFFDEQGVQTVFETKSAYPTRVKEILNDLYPSAQINIINSGISGDNAVNGNNRFERDIKPFNPDLVVVSFGLNDACQGKDNLAQYATALKNVFEKIKGVGAECIFIFQNMMNTKVSCHLKEEREKDLAKYFAEIQNNGIVDCYYQEAKRVAEECNIKFCDVYGAWKKMYQNGVDITEMLSNKYNHPQRNFHYYIAIKLVELMFDL